LKQHAWCNSEKKKIFGHTNLLVGCQFMERKSVIFAHQLVVGEGRPDMRDKMYRIYVWSKKEV